MTVARQNTFNRIEYLIKAYALHKNVYVVACFTLERLHHVTFFAHVNNFLNIVNVILGLCIGRSWVKQLNIARSIGFCIFTFLDFFELDFIFEKGKLFYSQKKLPKRYTIYRSNSNTWYSCYLKLELFFILNNWNQILKIWNQLFLLENNTNQSNSPWLKTFLTFRQLSIQLLCCFDFLAHCQLHLYLNKFFLLRKSLPLNCFFFTKKLLFSPFPLQRLFFK